MRPDPDPTSDVPGMNIWGWMSPEELTWLGEQAATMESVVEIGVLHGRSAYMLLTACPGTVYCIDPWDDEHDLSYGSFMLSCGKFPNLRAVRGLSPDVLDTHFQWDFEADMVFIDGDHSYESALADIEAWLPRTRKLLCGHDYQPDGGGFPGVAQAVHHVFGDDGFQQVPDLSIWTVNV